MCVDGKNYKEDIKSLYCPSPYLSKKKENFKTLIRFESINYLDRHISRRIRHHTAPAWAHSACTSCQNELDLLKNNEINLLKHEYEFYYICHQVLEEVADIGRYNDCENVAVVDVDADDDGDCLNDDDGDYGDDQASGNVDEHV